MWRNIGTMQKKEIRNLNFYGIQVKLIAVFLTIFCVIFTASLMLYGTSHKKAMQIEQTYKSNANLMEMQKNLKQMQQAVSVYLNTKDRDSLERYYDCVNQHEQLSLSLNTKIVNDENLIMEKNIRNLSEAYLELLDQAIGAKLGRNIEKYEKSFVAASKIYQYLDAGIYGLNNLQFHSNSTHYQSLMKSMEYSESVNIVILIIIGITSVLLIEILTSRFTRPLKQLAVTARKVGNGDLEVQIEEPGTKDEVGIVTEEFNRMISSLRFYIARQKESIELENAMKKKEILMETHLKDTQLKYLQAQIHPHFLFNTLNAGAQLAMMEGADETYTYIHKVSEFFRYNIRKGKEITTLRDEVELVENYIYILNVRFSNEIQLISQIEEAAWNCKIPRMILQPIVENCIRHGYQNKSGEKRIDLQAGKEENCYCISIRDYGCGMTKKQIEEIKHRDLQEVVLEGEAAHGIGLDNVMGRLKMFTEEQDVMEIESGGSDMGTEVTIFLPFEPRENVLKKGETKHV